MTTPEHHPKIRWKRWLRRGLLVALLLWLILAVAMGIAIHIVGQQDNAQPADVIIVLGAGLQRNGTPGPALTRRSRHAADLWQRDYADIIICSGGQAQNQQRSEADGCRNVLVRAGIPDSAIVLENRSHSTEENALYSGAIMQANGWDSAILVSDSFHILRANLIFTSRGYDVVLSPVPSRLIPDTAYYLAMVVREVFGIQWQIFKDALNLPITALP